MNTKIFSEKNLVVVLFVMVLITFSLAQEDTRKLEKMYIGITTNAASGLLANQPGVKKPELHVSQELLATPVE